MTLLTPLHYKSPKEGTDFEYIESETPTLTIRILTGPYKGIVYSYKYVALTPSRSDEKEYEDFDDIHSEYNMVEEEPEEVRLSFDYLITANPKQTATRHNPEFEILVGDILSEILKDAVSNEDSKYTMFTRNAEGGIEKLEPVGMSNVIEESANSKGFFGRILTFFQNLFS